MGNKNMYGLSELVKWVSIFDKRKELLDGIEEGEVAPRPFLEIYIQQLEQKFGKEEVRKAYIEEGIVGITLSLFDEIMNEKGYYKNAT